jgi:hypothetical protein
VASPSSTRRSSRARSYDLYVNGRKKTALVTAVEAQVELVRSILASEGVMDAPVRGALCMANPEGLPLFGKLTIRDISINGPRHIAKLVAEPGALTPAGVRAVGDVLERRLPPA